jgi:hypothetical protein
MHKSLPPHWNSKHDLPPRRCNCLLGINSQFDLIELVLDPVVVRAIVVQFLEHLKSIVRAINFNQVPRRFREEQHTAYDDQTWDALESEWEPPRE